MTESCIHFVDRSSGELIREVVPAESWLRWLYHHPLGKLALHSVVKRKFLSAWYGKQMDAPSSRTKIPDFINDLSINMDEALHPADSFKTFNEFFIRELKPEARPVHTGEEVIVSPADGKVVAFPGLNALDTFFAKGQAFSLSEFLKDKDLTAMYSGGTLVIVRLAPVDYHRFHFPAAGRISNSRCINGVYFSVSPHAVRDRLRIFWENKREISTLTTEKAGDILISEVGATMVGGITQSYAPDTLVEKGQEKGWFTFGGSTVVLLFEPDRVTIDADILSNTQKGLETTIKMGEHLARVN